MPKRRARGEGSVFFSAAKNCWVWRAVAGHKPNGLVRYTEGRAATQKAALKARQLAERQHKQPNEDKETVGEHLDHWLANVAKPNVRANTHYRYEQVVRLHLKPKIGGIPLRKLKVAAVNRLWAELSRGGMAPLTVKKCAEVLASALELAATEGKIESPPTRSAITPRVIDRPVEVFSDDEVRRILTAAKGRRRGVLFVLAVATGARAGELFALDSADFDPTAKTLSITKMLDQRPGGVFNLCPPKSASGVRTIGLPAFAVEVLTAHLADREPGPLFTTRDGNYVLRSNFVRKDWTPLLEVAAVPYRKFHTLRHTHASRLLADGVDPAEVARRIGDRIETVMKVYAHWIAHTGRDTAAKIEALYGPARPRLAILDDGEPEGGGKVANRKAN